MYLIRYEGIERSRIIEGFCFRVDFFGDEAVFGDEVHEHIPLPAIAERVLNQPRAKSTFDVLASRLYVRVKEVVGPLDLVPEKQIRLTEFELSQLVFLDEREPDHIENSKHPTSSRSFLVRNRASVREFIGDLRIEGIVYLGRKVACGSATRADTMLCHKRLRQVVLLVRVERGFILCQQFASDVPGRHLLPYPQATETVPIT